MRGMATSYQQLIGEVDRLSAQLKARYGPHLLCRAGCSGCCHHHLSVFEVEAAAVRQAVRALPVETHKRVHQEARAVHEREARGEPVACPLLVDDRCAIYSARPLICRTQGLPLLIEAEDGSPEVDFCSLNFTAPGATDELDEDHLVPLDQLNLKLAMANLDHCRQAGIELSESGRRRAMSDLILESCEDG
jgi:Fe-S-cluster containining protein